MIDVLISMGPWNWLIAGFVLMALELLAPGIFLFWLGLAALLTGIASFTLGAVLHLSWQAQCLLFALLSVAAVPLWRRMARGSTAQSNATNPFLNRRADGLVGRVFTLEKPIVGGVGTVRIDDTFWRVTGPDTPAGSRVKIVHADGVNLTVAAD